MDLKSSLTPLEVAELLKITKNTVYELIKRGELPSYKIGKKIRIDMHDVEEYINSQKSNSKPSNNCNITNSPLNTNINNINVKAESHRSDFTGETRATFDAIKYVDGNIPTSSQQFTFKLDELVNGKWASKYSAQNNGQYVKFNDIYYKNNNGTHWYLISETNNNDNLYN